MAALLAVTHSLLLNEVQVQRCVKRPAASLLTTVVSRNHAAEVVGNHAVVSGVEAFEN